MHQLPRDDGVLAVVPIWVLSAAAVKVYARKWQTNWSGIVCWRQVETMEYVVDTVTVPAGDITWLLETTNRMVGCRSLLSLLDHAYDVIRYGLGYDRVGLMIVDAEREWLSCCIGTDAAGYKSFRDERMVPMHADNFYTRLLRDPRLRVGGPGFTFLEGGALEETLYDRDYMDGQPRQNLLVSLRNADHVLGCISVDNLTSGRPILPEQARPLVAFASALGAMIENVALLDSRARRISDLDANLRLRVEHLSWLQETSSRLATLQDVDSVFDAIYASVRWGLQYDRVGLFLKVSCDGQSGMAELRGTDCHGEKTIGLDRVTWLDADTASHSPDVHYLLQGHPYYYVSDRWAITPERFRGDLEGCMREQLVVALRHDGELIGFISVDNLVTGREIVQEDAAPLIAFASQAALAVSRAKLWADHAAQSTFLAQRVTELEWLRDMSRQINTARTIDSLLDTVYAGVRTGLHLDRVAIWLSDESGTQLEELRGTDVDGLMTGPRDRTLPLTGKVSVQQIPGLMLLLHGEVAYYLLEESEPPPNAPKLLKGPHTQKLLVALRSNEAVTGIIVVDNAISKRRITLDLAGPLQALCGQAGTAIQNVRLQAMERAERARLAVLVETTHALNSTLDSNEILRATAARLLTGLRASNVAFSYANAADRTYVLVAQEAAPGRMPILPDNPETTFDLYPMLERAVTEGEPFFATIEDQGLIESEREFLRQNGALSELVIPVSLRGETIGLLEVLWDKIGLVNPEMIGLCTAIAEQVAMALGNARLYADASRRADHDSLTGLYNHSALLERVDKAVADAASFSLVLLDVDNFKLFNDTYGHLTGNAVLVSITQTMRETCRDGDAGGRYGGDELALLLPGATRSEANSVMRRLTETIKQRPYVTATGAVIPISVSAGVACFPEDGHTRQELVAVADADMYQAKRRASVRVPSANIESFVAHLPASRTRDAADLLGDSPFGVLEGLVSAVDAKDKYTREHSEHVTHLALLLAGALGLAAEDRRVMTIAGLLHDVGKIGVPDRILRKPGALSVEEYDAIKWHVSYGVAIIRGVLDDKHVVDTVAYHHERWDGRGYPHAVSGEATPLLSRIMQVADAASSMLLDRPYRKGLEWAQVVQRLRAGSGSQFDPELVAPFVAAYEAAQADFGRAPGS